MSPFWPTKRIFPDQRGAKPTAVRLIPFMRGKRRTAAKRDAVARLAADQHDVVSREQMRRLGFSDKAIDHAVASGRLKRVFRSVYAIHQSGISERGRLRAAALACGAGALVSHRSAGALLGL